MSSMRISSKTHLYYQDYNASSPKAALLLHGLGVNGDSWSFQIPALLEAGFRAIVPDLPGFGKSKLASGSPSIVSTARDIAALLSMLNAAPACIVGISMGGAIALQMALDNPGSVDKLVLVNAFASIRPNRLDIWIFFLLRFLAVHMIGIIPQSRTVAKRIFPHPDQENLRRIFVEQVSQANPRAYRAAMRASARFDMLDRLGEIQAETLVMSGEQDNIIPLQNQVQMAGRIPCARQVVIPNGGHALIVERPDLVNQILVEFLTAPPDRCDGNTESLL